MKNNIILIGYMGCGKSTIGKQVAGKLKASFLDTDAWIEEKEGRTISEIFAIKGETYFRDKETECLKNLLKEKGAEVRKDDLEELSKKEQEQIFCVISVGGGLPVREENQKLLKQLGHVIYLKAKPDTIYERIKGDNTRPLLQTENPLQKIQDMMLFREEKYQAAAHEVLSVDGKSIGKIVDEIMKEKMKYENSCN